MQKYSKVRENIVNWNKKEKYSERVKSLIGLLVKSGAGIGVATGVNIGEIRIGNTGSNQCM